MNILNIEKEKEGLHFGQDVNPNIALNPFITNILTGNVYKKC
jgi:hypothetical protein